MLVKAGAPALTFRARGARASHDHATPSIELLVEVGCDPAYEIRTVSLNVDVRIAAPRRRYDAGEREKLCDIFGEAAQWPQSLRNLQWMRASLSVPRFEGSTMLSITLPCTYDFDVSAAKYLAALECGEIPVDVLFSGTVFYCGDDGSLQTAMIPWESEISCRIPVATWREAVDAAFPDSAWIRMRRDTLARLQAYRARHAHVDWEETFDDLLTRAKH